MSRPPKSGSKPACAVRRGKNGENAGNRLSRAFGAGVPGESRTRRGSSANRPRGIIFE